MQKINIDILKSSLLPQPNLKFISDFISTENININYVTVRLLRGTSVDYSVLNVTRSRPTDDTSD